MKAYIEQLFDYNYWANGLILKYAERLTPEQFTLPVSEHQGSPREILAHIMFAERYWLDRMQGTAFPVDVMKKQIGPQKFPEIKDLYGVWFDLELRMRQFLADLDENKLPRTFKHTRSDGTELEYRYIDILTHVVFHGTQHRAEMALILTNLGHSPGNIDYSLYLHP
jgi:uncharacterized damage-inducible protein DinB